jgi:hypothetical protein
VQHLRALSHASHRQVILDVSDEKDDRCRQEERRKDHQLRGVRFGATAKRKKKGFIVTADASKTTMHFAKYTHLESAKKVHVE